MPDTPRVPYPNGITLRDLSDRDSCRRHRRRRPQAFMMKAPAMTDTLVKVTAYLADDDFGYDNWHARQFAAARDRLTRPALLVLCADEADRDRLMQYFGRY